MAKIAGNLTFPGVPGFFTAYKQKGSENVSIRRKTGPTSEKIKYDSTYDLPRAHGKEFGGRSTMSGYIRKQWSRMGRRLADQDLAGRMINLLISAQLADSENHAIGQRSILLSKNPRILEGLNINRHIPLDTIIRNPVNCTINREALTARVDIPALIPGVNLFVPIKYTAFSLFPVFSIVPDFHFRERSKYIHEEGYSTQMIDDQNKCPWFSSRAGMPATIIDLKINLLPPDTNYSLMIVMGMLFGHLDDTHIDRGAGTAKILAMG